MRAITIPKTNIKGIETALEEQWKLYNPGPKVVIDFKLHLADGEDAEECFWINNGVVAIIMENKFIIFPETPELLNWIKRKGIPKKRMYVPISDGTIPVAITDPDLKAAWQEIFGKYIVPNWIKNIFT